LGLFGGGGAHIQILLARFHARNGIASKALTKLKFQNKSPWGLLGRGIQKLKIRNLSQVIKIW